MNYRELDADVIARVEARRNAAPLQNVSEDGPVALLIPGTEYSDYGPKYYKDEWERLADAHYPACPVAVSARRQWKSTLCLCQELERADHAGCICERCQQFAQFCRCGARAQFVGCEHGEGR